MALGIFKAQGDGLLPEGKDCGQTNKEEQGETTGTLLPEGNPAPPGSGLPAAGKPAGAGCAAPRNCQA